MITRAYRRLLIPSWPMLAGGGGTQIIYSAAADRQSALHVGAASPHYLLPLGMSTTTCIPAVSANPAASR
jgi:hypothetical protein